MRIRFFVMAFAAAAAFMPVLAGADGITSIKDQQLNTYFNFAGVRFRIDKIETASHGDGRPIVQKAGDTPEGTGYIIVSVSLQNASGSNDISIPSPTFGFELADGSQIDERSAEGYTLVPSLTDPPDSLHPKQHVDVAYVFSNWNGQPITKMFVKNNGGTEDNNAGYLYVRFMVPKNYVQPLQLVPTPQPTD